jgi:hypothetical protein
MFSLAKSIDRIASAAKLAASALAAEATITASSAMAQQVTNGGGGDAPFATGITTGLNWVHFGGAAIAVAAFIIGCILLYMRNVLGAGAAFLFVVVGAAFMANANSIITQLTSLTFS